MDQTADTGDATALRAEGYADLVSSAQYFVTMGAATGTVHLYQYTGDIEQAVNNACDAILYSDPVGAYALRDVTCEYTHIVSYYECVFTYRYRRTMDQIAAIQPVNGKAAFRREVAAALTGFAGQLVLKSSSYYDSAETVQREIWEVYYDTPEAALAPPKITVQLYPNRGAARVVEINLDWGLAQMCIRDRLKPMAPRNGKREQYGNESISALKGAERVRKRPGVIFSSNALEGCQHAVFEILSNAIDEARERCV